ncbi:MAG: acyltransferase [Actinomycetota bacterium]|nr:acyltransferase [Actinomycetota bacterium]
MTWLGHFKGVMRKGLELAFNMIVTHIPSRRLRRFWLRTLGAELASNSAIFRGTTVLHPLGLQVGDNTTIGWRCVLDARAGIRIGANVSIASDTQLITADHDINDPEFAARMAPIEVHDHAWLATRALLLKGVVVGEGAVVAAGAVVTKDVAPRTVVAGNPARRISDRRLNPEYTIDFNPRWY